MEARLKDVNNLVKIKNPSLLLQLQKQNPQMQAQGSMNQSKTSKFMR